MYVNAKQYLKCLVVANKHLPIALIYTNIT